jgi:outer membrane protein TolC
MVVAAIASAGIANADGGSMSFAAAVAAAARQTPATRIAELKTREAQARQSQARGMLLPSLTGTASQVNRTANLKTSGFDLPSGPGFSLPDLIGPYNVMDARLTVRQPLFDASSWYRLRAARAGVAGATAEGELAAEQAAQGAALAYLRAARAQAVVEAREADVRIAAELLTLAEWQQRAGTSPAIDTTRARTQVVSAQGAVLLARNAAGRARIDLARALGTDPASPPVLSDTLSETLGASDAPADTAIAAEFARAHRPELTAEQAKLGRSRTERSAIGAERLPRLDVMADWGLSGIHWNDAFPTHDYGAALTLPLVDGLRREARIAEQSSVEHESEVRLRDLKDQVAADVVAALLDLGSGDEQLRVADERVALGEAELVQARERFTSGVSGNIEVINAQASLVRARDAQIDARYAIAAARVAVARAAGVARTLH